MLGKKQKPKSITLDQVESIIRKWTYDQVNDPVADRDALEAILSFLREDKDPMKVSLRISEIRREKIKADQEAALEEDQEEYPEEK